MSSDNRPRRNRATTRTRLTRTSEAVPGWLASRVVDHGGVPRRRGRAVAVVAVPRRGWRIRGRGRRWGHRVWGSPSIGMLITRVCPGMTCSTGGHQPETLMNIIDRGLNVYRFHGILETTSGVDVIKVDQAIHVYISGYIYNFISYFTIIST